MRPLPHAARHWWHRHDLGYCLGLGAAACIAVLLAGALPVMLPARLLCQPDAACVLDHWRVLDHLFVWDSGWYDLVAIHGYDYAAGSHGPHDIAFLPLWPLILRAGHLLFPGALEFQCCVTGIAVCCALGAVVVFHHLARQLLDPAAARRATLLYVTFPGMHFMVQSYPVGLMNLLCGLSLIAILRRRFVRAAVWSGIATAAGPIAVSISAVVCLASLAARAPRLRAAPARGLATLGLVGGLSASGLIGFMLWQYAVFGNALAFVEAQTAWEGAPSLGTRIDAWIRYELVYPDFTLAWHYLSAVPQAANRTVAQWGLQIGLNAAGQGFALLALGGLAAQRRAWPVLLQAWLAIALVIWFVATLREPDCAMRLLYLAPGCFIGLARLTRRVPAACHAVAALSFLVLQVQAFLGGAGYWVV